MKLFDIGFGGFVAAGRVLALISPDSAPVKRLIQEARERGDLVDATYGRKTQTVVICDTHHVILSALAPETLNVRLFESDTEVTA